MTAPKAVPPLHLRPRTVPPANPTDHQLIGPAIDIATDQGARFAPGEDNARRNTRAMAEAVDYLRHRYAIGYTDRNPMPFFNWWPWLTTAQRAQGEARERITDAWSVLRHGYEGWSP